MKYRVKSGQHDQYGKIYKKGDVLDTDLPLIEMFANKFEEVIDTTPVTKAPAALDQITPMKPKKNPPAPPKEKKEEVEVPKEDGLPEGKEVTKKFGTAVDMDYRVFLLKRKHYVYDTDDMSKPVNKEPLKKTEVEDFIDSLDED